MAKDMTHRPDYYLIVNKGTMLQSERVRRYPYHLVLAQMWLADADLRQAMLRLKRTNPSNRIILDNGAHEGELVTEDDYKEVIDHLRPDVVVLPDRIGEPSYLSRTASLHFSEWMEANYPTTKRMYAPQGNCQSDIIAEYLWAYRNLDPHKYIVGFGQSYLTFERPRENDYQVFTADEERLHEDARQYLMMKVICALSETRTPLPVKVPSHILGARWVPRDFSSFVKPLNIIGLDTIKPCTCTLQDMSYPHHDDGKAPRMSDECANELRLIQNINRLCMDYGLNQTVPAHWGRFGD